MPLGGLIALAALAHRQELLLVVVGGVFRRRNTERHGPGGGYKLTRKRLLACSPLHNHYLFKGMHETKIVTRFWIVGALLAVVALASLKLR